MRCFFSNLPIDSFDPLDVAVIPLAKCIGPIPTNESDTSDESKKCMCSLKLLVSYLYDVPKQKGTSGESTNDIYAKFLPKSIESIYDGISYALTFEKNDDDIVSSWRDHYDIVSFKFNRQSYHMSVLREEEGGRDKSGLIQNIRLNWQKLFHGNNLEVDKSLAQQRICSVLGIDSEHMKILQKGKVIHPNKSASPRELSRHLITISNMDGGYTSLSTKKKKYLSLVVIGTRREDVFVDKTKKSSFLNQMQWHWIGLSFEYKILTITIGIGLFYFFSSWVRKRTLAISDDDFFEL